MKTLKQIFEEGRSMLLEGRAMNIRQSPYHHKVERICWQAGLAIAQEELNQNKPIEKKAEEKPKKKSGK